MANLANLKPGNKRGPAKTTTALKEAILAAAQQHGEDGAGEGGLQGYMFKVAREDVKAFAGLLGRVLPLTVQGSGSDGAFVTRVEWAIVRPDDPPALP